MNVFVMPLAWLCTVSIIIFMVTQLIQLFRNYFGFPKTVCIVVNKWIIFLVNSFSCLSTIEINLFSCCCCRTSKGLPGFLQFPVYSIVSLLLCIFGGYSTDRLKRKNLRDKFRKSTRLWAMWQSYTGCPKSSFLYFMSL